MKYFDALFPSAAMAVIFCAVIITIIRNQGGSNKGKEDAMIDAALRERETVPAQPSSDD